MKNSIFFLLLILCLLIKSNKYSYSQQSCDNIIHVSINGVDDVNNGTENNPCRTINYGITRAIQEGYKNVRIGQGVYNEVVILKNGVNIWGGFSDTWDQISQSTITGDINTDSECVGVEAINITNQTIVSDFIIASPNASVAGKSSYAFHIINSKSLII